MKRLLYLAAALVLAAFASACGSKDNPEATKVNVTGCWELASVTTKASVGSVTVSVYVEFKAGGSFVLYQKIGEGRYSSFSGTYQLSDENALSGSYSGGKAWGPYSASLSGTSLVLTSASGKEVDTYKKIESIPASVTENVY